MRYPSGPEDLEIDNPVDLVDIMPTILDFLGLSSNQRLRGDNLVGLINGSQGGPQSVLMEHSDEKLIGLVTRHYKFIRHQKDSSTYPGYSIRKDKIELYDIHTDPGETENIAEANPDLVGRLEREMRRLLDDREGFRYARGRMGADTEEKLRALGYR
jgi:arylsulfatase A-like enzyme